jgi:hypothetical protein
VRCLTDLGIPAHIKVIMWHNMLDEERLSIQPW